MDIQYLLLLQEFRAKTDAFLSPIMDFVTKLSVSVWLVVAIAFIYWVFDKKAGRRILSGFSFSLLLNGFLKLVCCVYRPWIKDPRIEPWGDAKVAATGYSFPSGHSTWASSIYGGIAVWQRKHFKWICGVMIFMIAITMFSRNYLGVHTPQDVIVGCLGSLGMLYISYLIEKWTDKNPDRNDMIMLVGGLVLCVVLVFFYNLKSYPLDYLADGTLLVDPKKMTADSYEGIGLISSYVVCRYFARRHFDFESAMASKDRFIVSVVAIIPLYIWDANFFTWFEPIIGRPACKYLYFSVIVAYIMILVPWIMTKIKIPENISIMEENK